MDVRLSGQRRLAHATESKPSKKPQGIFACTTPALALALLCFFNACAQPYVTGHVCICNAVNLSLNKCSPHDRITSLLAQLPVFGVSTDGIRKLRKTR